MQLPPSCAEVCEAQVLQQEHSQASTECQWTPTCWPMPTHLWSLSCLPALPSCRGPWGRAARTPRWARPCRPPGTHLHVRRVETRAVQYRSMLEGWRGWPRESHACYEQGSTRHQTCAAHHPSGSSPSPRPHAQLPARTRAAAGAHSVAVGAVGRDEASHGDGTCNI